MAAFAKQAGVTGGSQTYDAEIGGVEGEAAFGATNLPTGGEVFHGGRIISRYCREWKAEKN